jgi:hypothetical protein
MLKLHALRRKYIVKHLHRAWSVWLIGIAAFLSGLEAILPLFIGDLPGTPRERGFLIFGVVVSAFVARCIVQNK